MLAEATAALPALKANATAPASGLDVERVIAAKFATYRQPERSDAEWAAFWADYHTVLDETPLSALEAAMEACLRDSSIEFLPKPAKIRDMALMTPNRSVRAYERAKAAVEHQPPVEREKVDLSPLMRSIDKPRVEPSQADKDRVRRQMRDYIAQDDARKAAIKAKTSDLPPCHATTDETGLSAEMRAMIQGKQG